MRHVELLGLPEDFHFLKENGRVVSTSVPIRACVVDGSLAGNDSLCVILTNEEPFRSCPAKAPPVSGLGAVVNSVIEARGDELASQPIVQNALASISTDFASMFSPIPPGDPLIRCPSGVHSIDLQDGCVPKCKRPYRLPPDREKALLELLYEFKRLGWIEPADAGAEWASPAFPVPKKSHGEVPVGR